MVLALAALCQAAPLVAQTTPGVAGEALVGSPAALPAISTVTGRTVKLPLAVQLCQAANGVDYAVCPAAGRGGANLATAQISVGTGATLVAASRAGRGRLIVTQSAAGPCYFSASPSVSATTGARLTVAGASKTLNYSGAYYGICPGGAVTIDVDEEY